MRTSRTRGLRLGVILLFLIGLLAPAATPGAGAQDVTCDDFTSERAAQRALDEDPDLEDALDPDGDGIACNEEASEDEPAADEEEATAEDEDEPAASDDEFVTTISDEVSEVEASFERFDEIFEIFGDATDAEQGELAAEVNEITEGWAQYPEVAAGIDIPADYEDLGDAYIEFADAVGGAGEAWIAWTETEPDTPEDEEAWDVFMTAREDVDSTLADVQAAIDDAGGSTGDNGDDPTPEATAEDDDNGGGGDADVEDYAAGVQDQVDTFNESVTEFETLMDDAITASEDGDDAALQEAIDGLTAISEDWAAYPDTVEELGEAPEGAEDLGALYEDFAANVGTAGEEFQVWLGADSGSDEEAEAEEAYQTALADAQDGAVEIQDEIDTLTGGGSSENGDDPTPEDEETPEDDNGSGGDAETYIADVQDALDTEVENIDRVNELFGQVGDASEAEIQEIFSELDGIFTDWGDYGDVVAELGDAPEGAEDVGDAYTQFGDDLVAVSDAWTAWLETESGTPENDEAFDEFMTSMENVQASADDVQAAIDDATGTQVNQGPIAYVAPEIRLAA